MVQKNKQYTCLKLELNQRPSGFQPDALTTELFKLKIFLKKNYIVYGIIQ